MYSIECDGVHPIWIINAWDKYVADRRGTKFDYMDPRDGQKLFERDLGVKLNYTWTRHMEHLESISFESEGDATLFVLRWS